MQKKKCIILEIIGLVVVVAAVIVVLPKAIAFVKSKFSKNDVDDMEFEFEDEFTFEDECEFVKPEPMKPEEVKENAAEADVKMKEDIFEEE